MEQLLTITVTIRDNDETIIHLENGVADRSSLVAFSKYFAHLSNVMAESAKQITLH
jgi:hypothetical protein